MDFEAAHRARDRRLRRHLLLVLSVAARTSPSGMVSGRFLVDQANSVADPGEKFEDEAHALSLMRDLLNAKLAVEAPLGERRRGQRFGLSFVQYGITDEGTQLIEERRTAHPLVDDDRHLDE